MGRLVPLHVGARPATPPTPDLFEPLVDKTDGPHWYWNGDFADDGDLRHAVLRHGGRSHVVIRLLWEHVNGASLSRRSLRNECGLMTCVRPDHFALVEPRQHVRHALPSPCVLAGGDRADVVNVDYAVTHILVEGATWYACQRRRVPATVLVPAGTEITCVDCVRAWASLGRPLEVVPCR